MSHFSNIVYRIYKSSGKEFDCMLDCLLSDIDERFYILRLVFFCDIINNSDYLNKLRLLRAKIGKKMPGKEPVVTLVSQKPLDSDLVLEVHGYLPSMDEQIVYKKYGEFSYVTLINEFGRFLYVGGLYSSCDKDIYIQGNNIFRTLKFILQLEGFSVASIVRQWNYIGNITSYDSGGNQNYQMFNNARSEFYASSLWPAGYPAATGIGTHGKCLVVDVDAVISENKLFNIKSIDNKLQVAAHLYSDKVLEKVETGLSTPKFERAKSLNVNDECLIYVSGTAAIRGEKSIVDNVVEQLKVTLENIKQLTENSEIKLLRVYLKNATDYQVIYNILSLNTNIQISYLHADVCRNELLLEIEGISLRV